VLPERFEKSGSAFQGMWEEAGTFENIEQALAFAKAWLLDRKEIDDLPSRTVRRCGV
jgi:hypothetical protein